jgi:hypothetical protein
VVGHDQAQQHRFTDDVQRALLFLGMYTASGIIISTRAENTIALHHLFRYLFPLETWIEGKDLGKKINFAKRSLQNQMSIASQVAVLRNVFLIGCLWWRLPVWLRPTPIIIIAPRSMM